MKKTLILSTVVFSFLFSGCAGIGFHGKCQCECPTETKPVKKIEKSKNSQTIIQFKKSPFDDEENIQNILNGEM